MSPAVGAIVSSGPCRSTLSRGVLLAVAPVNVIVWPLSVVEVEVDQLQTVTFAPAAVARRPNHDNPPSRNMLRSAVMSYIASEAAFAFQ